MVYTYLIMALIVSSFSVFLLRQLNYAVDRIDRFFFILFATIIFIIIAFRYDVGHDYLSYKITFDTIHSGNINAMLGGVEFLYLLINLIFKNFRIFLIVVATFSFFVKAIYYYKRSYNRILCLLLYFCSIGLTYDMGVIRQGIALAILLFSIKYIKEKKTIKSFVVIVIAAMFHITSLFVLPLCFLGERKYSRKVYYGLPIATFLISSYWFKYASIIISQLGIDFISNKWDLYSTYQNVDIGIGSFIRRFIILFIVVEFYLRTKREEQSNEYGILVNGYFLSCIGVILFSEISLVSSRGFAFLYFLQIPLLAEISTNKKYKFFAWVAFVIGILLFVYSANQTLTTHNGTVYYPYKNWLFN